MKKIVLETTGYGNEVVIGKLTPEQADYLLENPENAGYEVKLSDDEMVLWHDHDDTVHTWGGSVSFCELSVEYTDESGVEVLNDVDIEELGIENEDCLALFEDDQHYLVSVNTEKGQFYYEEKEIEEEFDVEKLKLTIRDLSDFGLDIIVEDYCYDGEPGDNIGGGTDGKSFEQYIFINGDLIPLENE